MKKRRTELHFLCIGIKNIYEYRVIMEKTEGLLKRRKWNYSNKLKCYEILIIHYMQYVKQFAPLLLRQNSYMCAFYYYIIYLYV